MTFAFAERELVLKTTYKSLGKMEPDIVFLAVSPDNRHLAYVVQRAGKLFVVADGVQHKAYDWISEDTPVFSPDGRRMAYVAMAQAEDKGPFPVVDGVELKQFFAAGMYLRFSQDGRRLAYAAAHRAEEGQCVVVDEVAGKEYDGIGKDSLRFSPDGRRFAYGSRRGNKWCMVIDCQEQKAYDGLGTSLIFSPDSQRWAYVGEQHRGLWRMRRKMDCVVVDGVESGYYDGTALGSPIFSPDSKRVAYGASRHNAMFAVVDGKEEQAYERLEFLTFSPDSRKLAYVAWGPVAGHEGLRRDHAFRAVVNGVEGKPYLDISLSGIRFSPDSERTAYVMQNFEGWWAVIDGVEQGPYQGIGEGCPLFSPDSRHCAYTAWRERTGKRVVVVDGTPSQDYDAVGGLAFSPGSRRLAYAAKRGATWCIVVDHDQTADVYDAMLDGSALVWDSEDVLHTVAIRDGEFVAVEVQPIGER